MTTLISSHNTATPANVAAVSTKTAESLPHLSKKDIDNSDTKCRKRCSYVALEFSLPSPPEYSGSDAEEEDQDRADAIQETHAKPDGLLSRVKRPCLRRNSSIRDRRLSKSSRGAPKCDLAARQRCLDYLVEAVDEAWARYYDSTSNAELEIYTEDAMSGSGELTMAAKLYYSESEADLSDSSSASYDSAASATSANTAVTSESCIASTLPKNVRLQNIKDRLLSAKYELEELVDDDTRKAAALFWSRWDKVKYTALDLCEEDEEDSDQKLEQLEDGRWNCDYNN
ncbi:hypothetical protein CANCADRAFT_56770 [Tortispora caseinolytica NRRL Y-17796]|uniref:Uncharacterized protein n=1 Tax=Tortispora caseinolytica NRRL Y-17796 TaxID=767744 RepID=A0A1E4TEK7_9ASCO|nr:hypothetical protein CANCADRAFT_56770 [Tortispora caseinolytica NRRL Y-17796]